MPPFIIDAFDEDQALVGKNNADYLCRAMINVEDCVYSEGDAVPEPKWHPMKFDQKSPTEGEVLVSFAIVEDDFSFKRDLNYVALDQQVEMREF